MVRGCDGCGIGVVGWKAKVDGGGSFAMDRLVGRCRGGGCRRGEEGGLGEVIDVDGYGMGGVGTKEEARHVSDVDGEGMGGVG